MKIEQENDYPLEVWKLNNSMRVTQIYDDSEGYITIQNTSSREVALAIHPDLEREKEEFAVGFAEWFTKNTGRFADDILALREGKYIELYKNRDNGK